MSNIQPPNAPPPVTMPASPPQPGAPNTVTLPYITPPPTVPLPAGAELTKLPAEPAENATLGARLRWWAFKYVGTLVMEPTPAGDYVMSLGKFSAAALLAQAMWRWGIEGTDIPQTMLQTLWALLTYTLGSRGINIAHMAVQGGQTSSGPTAPPPKNVLL